MTTFHGMFAEEHRSAWEDIIARTSIDRPSKGKRVRVTSGRKYKGVEGVVVWHGLDKFSNPHRFYDSAQITMSEIMGRNGYRVKIQPDNGQPFYVSADWVVVLEPSTGFRSR